MRLFTAINFSESTKDNLCSSINKLKFMSESGNFTRRENLHLTLVFIGEVSEKDCQKVKDIMKLCASQNEKFNLNIEKSGRFKRDGGDIVWAGIEKNQPLIELQKQMTELIIKSGFHVDEREYSPHLTLGREIIYSSDMGFQKIRDTLDGMISGSETVSRISLMKSERIRGVLTYTEIFSCELSSKALNLTEEV